VKISIREFVLKSMMIRLRLIHITKHIDIEVEQDTSMEQLKVKHKI